PDPHRSAQAVRGRHHPGPVLRGGHHPDDGCPDRGRRGRAGGQLPAAEDVLMYRQVVNELLSRPPRPGNRISFVRLDGSRSLELTELYEQSGRLATQLAEAGLRAGDRIGILAEI